MRGAGSDVRRSVETETSSKTFRATILIEEKIEQHYTQWKKIQYKFGGTNSIGIDCSAFVQIMYKEKFNTYLPRTALKQMKSGWLVMKEQLIPGDLIFFMMAKDKHHVGIYVGNGKFMHASSSQGVTLSNLNAPYWQLRYDQSRRVIT
ncbi:hypothetical protein HCO56_21125 [Serratia marcescens]|nr:hypothetical protein [Serratia marcescens]